MTLTGRAVRRAILAAGLIAAAAPARAAVVYTVAFNDPSNAEAAYHAEIAADLLAAGADWSGHLIGTGTVNLQVNFDAEATASGASATSVLVGTRNGLSVYEQGAAYAATGGEGAHTAVDGVINIGTSYLSQYLWFDPAPATRTAPVPAGRVDAVSVFLHELCHIFAFNGFRNAQTGALPGSYESTFDQDVSFTSTAGGVTPFFTGANAEAIYGGPVPLTYGDYPHFGNTAPRPGSDLTTVAADELMNGVTFYTGLRYDVSPLDLSVLKDTGVPVRFPEFVAVNVPEPLSATTVLVAVTAVASRRRRT